MYKFQTCSSDKNNFIYNIHVHVHIFMAHKYRPSDTLACPGLVWSVWYGRPITTGNKPNNQPPLLAQQKAGNRQTDRHKVIKIPAKNGKLLVVACNTIYTHWHTHAYIALLSHEFEFICFKKAKKKKEKKFFFFFWKYFRFSFSDFSFFFFFNAATEVTLVRSIWDKFTWFGWSFVRCICMYIWFVCCHSLRWY